MEKLRHIFMVALCVVAMIFTFSISSSYAYDITIDVSPNVLNIGSASTVVTVHTDVAYNIVVGSSVYLNGIAIDWWKADDRGYFVAKFSSDEVKSLDGLIINDYNELVLTGFDTAGGSFIGKQNIMVVDNEPQKKK